MDLYIDSQGHYIIEEETNGMPPETTKWLRINGHVPSDLEPKSATFKPVGATMETPTYTVLWAGSIEFPTDRSKPLHVKLWSRLTGGQLYFSLNYRKERHNGTDVAGIYMIENGGPLSGERIGWVPPGVRQSITIFINTENRTMTITGNGIPENIVKPIPERITDMRAPMVSMGYYEIGIGAFRLDNISIIESKKREEE